MGEDKIPTRLYANQGTTLLFAVLCAGFCVYIGVTAHQHDTKPLSLYDIAVKVLIVAVCWAAGGSATLIFLFWTVVPIPLIELDEEGVRWRLPIWRVPPLKQRAVQWRDVRSVSFRQRRFRGVATLKITFRMKHAATITHHVPREVELAVSQTMVSVSAERIMSLLSAYTHVTDSDKELKRLLTQHRERVEREAHGKSAGQDDSA